VDERAGSAPLRGDAVVQFVAQQQGSYTSYFTSVVSLSSTRADKLYYSTTTCRTPVCVTRPPKMTLPRAGYNRGGGGGCYDCGQRGRRGRPHRHIRHIPNILRGLFASSHVRAVSSVSSGSRPLALVPVTRPRRVFRPGHGPGARRRAQLAGRENPRHQGGR
jgi:hypothetical protein